MLAFFYFLQRLPFDPVAVGRPLNQQFTMITMNEHTWHRPPAARSQDWILPFAFLLAICLTPDVFAQTHSLRPSGRTLIEGEDFAEAAEQIIVESSERCSGNRTLAYFWGNTWVEWNIDVPQMLNYNLTLRASAEKSATQIAVQVVDETGQKRAQTTIDVPKTDSWSDYIDTKSVPISLPAGRFKLRFVNLVDGANIDFITLSAGVKSDVVSTQPIVNDGPSKNPLKGFISGWNRPNAQHASVGLQYIDWAKLEPQDDVFDWEAVEQVLNRSGTKGRHHILQLVTDWDDNSKRKPIGNSHYRGPSWLLERVEEFIGPAFPNNPDSRIARATAYNNPVFIEEATEAIAALVQHYRDDPRTFVIQVGVLGFRGEWHTLPRKDWSPNMDTKFAILDAYIGNQDEGGLSQVRFPDQPIVEPKEGLGYTNSSGMLTKQGRKFQTAVFEGELWRYGPIGGEWSPNTPQKHWENFFLSSAGLDLINDAKYSTLLIPSVEALKKRLPGWNQEGLFKTMHQQLGYNFRATAVRHLVSADQSDQTHIEVDLENAGIAPFYKNWDVQLAIINTKTSAVSSTVEISLDIRDLLPGQSTTISGSCTEALDPRIRYQIGLRIIQAGADKAMSSPWKLDARNTYIELGNSIDVTAARWVSENGEHTIQGGWNLLDVVEHREATVSQPIKGKFFPFQGSFRRQ